MKQSNPDEIKKVYLFTGKIDPRRQSAVDDLVARIVDADSAAFDLEKFDGDTSNAEKILAAANMAPFTSERKVVIVDQVDKLSADDQSRIAGFIPKLGERSCLILLGGEADSSRKKTSASKEGNTQKSMKGLQSELAAAVKKHGAVVNFAKLKSEALGALIMEAVKSQGKKIEPAALQALVRSVESNPSVIKNEVEKLATYAADRDTITFSDVDKLISKSPEDRLFPFIDAIAAKQQDRVVQLLDETLAASAKPDNEVLRILSMMARHFRMLYQVRFLRDQGIRNLNSVPEEIQSMLPVEQNPLSMMDWQREKLVAQSNHFTLKDIRECLRQVLACELVAKGQDFKESSPRLNLEMMVIRLSQRR